MQISLREKHRLRSALFVCIAILILADAGVASAQGFDARGMAMGGVAIRQENGRLARINPAYLAVPPRMEGAPRAIPIPIGLIQAVRDFPELDPEEDDFDALAIVNYASNIPWAWEFRRPESLDTDVELTLGQDELIIDLNDAQSIIPDEGFDIGTMSQLWDLGYTLDLGEQHGSFRVTVVQPFMHTLVDFDLDDELRDVLSEAKPVEGNRPYGAQIDALLQGGFKSGLTYARELGVRPPPASLGDSTSEEDWLASYWEEQANRPRFWVGVGYRRYFGMGYARLEGDVTMTTGDPLFADTAADSFDVDYNGYYTRAWMDGLGSFGTGNAIDLGAVMRWRKLELGAGVSDVFTELSWDNSTRDRAVYDEDLGQVINEQVRDNFTTKTEIPKSWLLNGSYLGEDWTVGFNLVEEPGGFSMHGGGEYWPQEWLALRGGLERDQRQMLQGGWGFGLKFNRFGWDVGFQTHSRGFTDRRGISMGIALVLY